MKPEVETGKRGNNEAKMKIQCFFSLSFIYFLNVCVCNRYPCNINKIAIHICNLNNIINNNTSSHIHIIIIIHI